MTNHRGYIKGRLMEYDDGIEFTTHKFSFAKPKSRKKKFNLKRFQRKFMLSIIQYLSVLVCINYVCFVKVFEETGIWTSASIAAVCTWIIIHVWLDKSDKESQQLNMEFEEIKKRLRCKSNK